MPTAVGSPMPAASWIFAIRTRSSPAPARFSGVFPIGLALIEERFGKLGIEEAEKAMSELGLVGIVGHPPIAEWCIPLSRPRRSRGLVNLHMHNPLMDRIAAMFPHCTFIAHASTWAAEHLAKYDNVFSRSSSTRTARALSGISRGWPTRWAASG